jgi:hypothetical protein
MGEAIVCRKSDWLADWYVIESNAVPVFGEEPLYLDGRLIGSSLTSTARISDADVEGTGDEMLAIADAIERGEPVGFKRCAVKPIEGGGFALRSPRNSQEPGAITAKQAAGLVASIRATVRLGITAEPTP